MQLWFSEMQTPNVKFSIRVERQLYSGQSEFQRSMCLSPRNSEDFLLWTAI